MLIANVPINISFNFQIQILFQSLWIMEVNADSVW